MYHSISSSMDWSDSTVLLHLIFKYLAAGGTRWYIINYIVTDIDLY